MLIAKRQTEALLAKVLDACAHAGVHPVVNLITGFPGEEPAAAAAMRALVEEACWGPQVTTSARLSTTPSTTGRSPG